MWHLLTIALFGTLVTSGTAEAKQTFACNLSALTPSERSTYQKLSRQLLHEVQERRELKNGYAFRLPPDRLSVAAEWVSFERRCCPFFSFEIAVTEDNGPLWLRLTGGEGIKAFIRAEFGIEE